MFILNTTGGQVLSGPLRVAPATTTLASNVKSWGGGTLVICIERDQNYKCKVVKAVLGKTTKSGQVSELDWLVGNKSHTRQGSHHNIR